MVIGLAPLNWFIPLGKRGVTGTMRHSFQPFKGGAAVP
jgi:hypothetical protein